MILANCTTIKSHTQPAKKENFVAALITRGALLTVGFSISTFGGRVMHMNPAMQQAVGFYGRAEIEKALRRQKREPAVFVARGGLFSPALWGPVRPPCAELTHQGMLRNRFYPGNAGKPYSGKRNGD